MPSSQPALRFLDIVDNVDRIERYTERLTFEAYQDDRLIADAVERCLARISEAAVKLAETAAKEAPGHDWAAIRAFGNILRHEYEDVADEVIWQIVIRQLPALKADCAQAAARLEQRNV